MGKYITAADRLAIKHWIPKLTRHGIGIEATLEALDLPYPYIGAGKSRMVFDLDETHVLKIAYKKAALNTNDREVRLYRTVPSKLRKYLSTIKDYGDGWIVMEKWEQRVPKSIEKKKLPGLKKKFAGEGFRLTDAGRNNIRWNPKKERIVMIDYANYECK